MRAAEESPRLRVNETEFDAVAVEIGATLSFCGVPAAEHQEFVDIIESYRSMVVQEPAAVAG